MLAKIKENAGAEYTHDTYNDTLRALRGTWVEVDTSYVFKNQYNLLNYPIRIFDKEVEAIQEDIRAGMVKCGYCGKQFQNTDELIEHYLEMEASAHECEKCTDYINGIRDITHDTKIELDEDGNKIETRITKYIHGKKCRWDACNKFEHRNHRPEYFTKENTYFLKYPNGYPAYFMSLSIVDQWREISYTWDAETRTATKTGAIGTYDAILYYAANGTIDGVTLKNSRSSIHFDSDDMKRIFSNTFNIQYLMTFDENGNRHEKINYSEMPKTLQIAIEKYFDMLRDAIRYTEYKRQLITGMKEGNEND